MVCCAVSVGFVECTTMRIIAMKKIPVPIYLLYLLGGNYNVHVKITIPPQVCIGLLCRSDGIC